MVIFKRDSKRREFNLAVLGRKNNCFHFFVFKRQPREEIGVVFFINC